MDKEIPELSNTQLAELGEELLRLRMELIASIADNSRTNTVDLDLPIGRLSRVDALQQQAMAAAEKRRAEQRLKAVEAALEFHGEGDYGYCKACGENLPFARLKVRPESPLCVACLAGRE